MARIWLIIALGLPVAAFSQTQISVLEGAWAKLSLEDRISIQKEYLISPVRSNSAGVIIDNQGADNSTPGSNGGSALGGAIASATYIDNAFRPSHNYSATGHLAAIILGNVLGSSLNRAPTREFHFRYAVRNGAGEIAYYDSISQSPFRHSVGICVLLPQVVISPNQDLCAQTAESLRAKYLKQDVSADTTTASQQISAPRLAANVVPISTQIGDEKVLCKLPELPPVQTSAKKCELINGEIIR